MKTSADYDTAFKVVSSVIDAWDPYSLLEGGAPPDEFHSEIKSLIAWLRHIRAPEDAAKEISSIFSAAFEPQYFTVTACTEVGTQLYDRLKEADLLSTPKA
jgi:hypothetical protein